MNSIVIAVAATASAAAVSFWIGTATGGVNNSRRSSMHMTMQLEPAKQMNFDDHLARKKAEFRSVVDNIKAENDAMRRKYDAL